MQRQDQRDVFGDAQVFRADGHALPSQLGDFIEERLRIDHHAVADDRKLGRPQDARRQQRQLVGFAVDDQRVAGIVAALEAHDDVSLLRQPVDDLALPLVAPLGADDDNIGHFADVPSATLYCTSMIGSENRCLLFRIMRPAKTRPGPLACEASHRIKDAGYRRKQERGFGTDLEGSQAIDIPRKSKGATGRRGGAAPGAGTGRGPARAVKGLTPYGCDIE